MMPSIDIDLRFSDLDAYGHVNNATVFSLLETARVRLYQDRFTELMHKGLLFLVAEARCRYLKPISLTDRLVIDIEPTHVGRTSFTLGYRLHNGSGLQFAEAETVMVCFDQRAGKPAALPDDFRLLLTSND
ncbi:MAG: acyl-CoA thioesterase [Deltaproteobacteria bacterium]|nr:MAG: acyl-CoA thioesterase [Deltaproteobacteria bacterium]